MSTVKLNASVISEKVSKIRWIPEQYSAPQSFVTGNWDFATNNVRIWTYMQHDLTDEDIEYVPKSTAKVNIAGDVTGIEFANLDNFLVSSSSGRWFCCFLLELILKFINFIALKVTLICSTSIETCPQTI